MPTARRAAFIMVNMADMPLLGLPTSQPAAPSKLIAQAGTPQRKIDDPKQIVGLQELDLFNDVSQEIYGRGPLKIVVIQCLGPRWMEFGAKGTPDEGKVVDFKVLANDPRTQWGADGEKPVATKFYDYLVWLPDQQDLCVLSFKSTQIKVAIQLNNLMKLPLKINGKVLGNPPSWARTSPPSPSRSSRSA